jgi:hypothetical protein
VALRLRELEVPSIPVNYLIPIEGNPVRDDGTLTPERCLRALCLMRLVNPAAEIRVAGGREGHLRHLGALALWPAFGRWTGGGFFETGRTVYIREPLDRMTAIEHVAIPDGIQVQSYGSMTVEELSRRFTSSRPEPPSEELVDGQREALLAAGARWVDFIVPRSEAELLFASDGRLYRLMGWRDVRPERYLAEATQIADFRDMRFRLVSPPEWAMQW